MCDAMTSRRRLRFVHGQIAWMLAATLALALIGSLDFQIFFAASFVGLLVMMVITAPVNVTPRWRSRLKWLVVLGLIGFGAILLHRILQILPPGVV